MTASGHTAERASPPGNRPARLSAQARCCHTAAMSDDDEQTHMRLRIEGFVQAVGYRNFVIAEAQRLGLDGWIRNRADGTVEALVSGPTKIVEIVVAACMRGPD